MHTVERWINKHPDWFRDLRYDPQHGDAGWSRLLEEAFDAVEKTLAEHPGASVRIVQIKEKLGALTVYFRESGLPSESADRLQETMGSVRFRSLRVCEICGAPARLGRLSGCFSVRCASCSPDGWEPAESRPIFDLQITPTRRRRGGS